MLWAFGILGGYLIGSVPFGLIVGHLRGIDIREHGSKNIGATNVGRVLGRPWGMLCFALDVAKGAVPVMVMGALMDTLNRPAAELTQAQMWWWLAVAIAPVVGHMFPLYIGFKGGKGVATGFGALAAMWPLLTFPALGALVVWYTALRLTKYVSVASIAAASSLPLFYVLAATPRNLENVLPALLHASPPLIVTAALALVIIVKHRSNIARLRRGEEPKIGGVGRRGDVLHEPPTTSRPSQGDSA